MKALFTTIAILVASALSTQTQAQTITSDSFEYKVAKLMHSKKFQTNEAIRELALMQDSTHVIDFGMLLYLVDNNRGLQNGYMFKLLSKYEQCTPEMLSTLISKYKGLQTDFCYKIYLDKKPSDQDKSWLKLTVIDFASSPVLY